ncbi:MAG: imelysin family protein [Pseudomonadota bacterium]
MRHFLTAMCLCAATPVAAQEVDLSIIVNAHILPHYEALAAETAALSAQAIEDCTPDSADLKAAYHDAFDAWVGGSHLRFGPSEQQDRAFALAFWPDPRGSTPKALAALIAAEDQVVTDPQSFAAVSVAARGFYALEFLLFDPQFTDGTKAEYHCALVKAVSADIAANASGILEDWQGGYGDLMANPGNETYRTNEEAARQAFTALSTGLEFTSQARLGRPLGSFDRPRPNRAEARRSERSLRHVILSLQATRDLAALISGGDENVNASFVVALQRAEALEDPVFASVADPSGRFRVEVLQQSIDAIRNMLAQEVGPSLGIAAGFNSLDGD